MIYGNIDIRLLTETKLDSSFPSLNFKLNGFKNPFRRDRSIHGGGIILYIREDISSKLLSGIHLHENCQCFFMELYFKNRKWLLGSFYNPAKSQISTQLSYLENALSFYSQHYDSYLIMGDFNSEMSEEPMKEFCEIFNLKNLVKEATCYKSTLHPTCIDLMITNRCRCFQNTEVVETDLSDFHKMAITVLRTSFKKAPPKIIAFRDHKTFSIEIFHLELVAMLNCHDVNNIDYDAYNDIVMVLVNIHAPLKYKYVRGNQSPFMNKELRKAIMTRSRLKNRFHRIKTQETHTAYKVQRNVCTRLLRKSKRSYYNNLNTSVITNNKMYWKTVKPLFSNNSTSSENIIVIDKNEILSDERKIANVFGNYFSVVKELNIEETTPVSTNCEDIADPILYCIKKI